MALTPGVPPSDADLIAAWRAGDEGAAGELVRRHARAVARFLGGAGAGDDVDDLVQETFFRAFRKIDGYRGGASFRTWVIGISPNALKEVRRRSRRRPAIPLETEAIPDEGSDPHPGVVARELGARVWERVSRV